MFAFFERLVNPFPPEHPSEPPKGLYAFCRHYSRGMEPLLIIMAILTAFTAIGEAMLYAILGQLVDWFSSQDKHNFLQQNWPLLASMAVFVLVLMPLSVVGKSLIVHQSLLGNYPMRVRWQAHRYLLNQSYNFFQHEFSGRIATKVMQTSLAVRETVMKLLDVMLFATIYLATMIILVASADWRLGLPLIVWLCCYISILRYFLPRLKRIATTQADARSLMTGRITDSYTNILTLKLFSHHQREAEYVREGMSSFLDTVHPQMRLVTLLNASVWCINMLLICSTATLGIYFWLGSGITAGGIAVALSLSLRLMGMSNWIMWEVSNLFEQIGTVQDGINTLAQSNAVHDQRDACPLIVKQASIDFQQVGFSYNERNTVFEQLNLSIRSGEKIGIVGRSGAGKSSLVNLLLRFYDVDSGNILIDGQNIRNVQQESLRSHIAMVTQDTSLLHRSVRENILFGRPNASEEEMLEAAKQAEAHEFILSLADDQGRTGYDAHVGERGVTLSGGQRQRIAIARVLLKDAPILILDEATSALDSEVEASIQQNLDQLMRGKTVIAIAHRLSTIAAMDRLVIFDNGKVIEQGSHQQLIEKGGIYAQLWSKQSGGFV
ncbi:ATP-binding cassette subfamily B protein/ATP-binding cassette subfamily B multidrug efflux pump [Sinobacterium caligoides]|uniref:ATP-binding cassette subfamily B protein/ATP-binding cassette subfamily B multidrug efflux pump n=1 Tax=Sinobacterium caligoides TaxID=933926 RepID=A0A3N2DYG0_9GAMM|nr:ABC transporter ATP-binding protein [Sinobacterium caligoides]ROS04906.1 ATP-binding cassette subfamily B protein/ATP-binding cassette subfamily B multidrug efflux pump [Sinobacterium caligoides]